MLKIFYIFITSLIFLGSAYSETVKVFEFTEKELSALEIRKVRGADNNTSYTVGSNEHGNFLKSSLTLAFTVTHSFKLSLVVANTLSIDFFV